MSEKPDVQGALSGAEISVDFESIERSLADLWKTDEGEHGVTKAALWNVVAHSQGDEEKNSAREILSTVSVSVPQRTILVDARHDAPDDMRAWISANCHIIGGGEKVCSEEITIVAGGGRVPHVPPIVNALLIPDMPVATWWLGDLPNDRNDYLDALLDPADRLIVDSSHFDSPSDLTFVHHLANDTNTRPADLNWSRIDDWREATASMFDAVDLRARMGAISRVDVEFGAGSGLFGDEIEARLYATWLLQRLGYVLDDAGIFLSPKERKVEVRLKAENNAKRGLLNRVTIALEEGIGIDLVRQEDAGAIRSEASGLSVNPITVTRMTSRRTEELIVRELARSGADRVYVDVLPLALRLSRS